MIAPFSDWLQSLPEPAIGERAPYRSYRDTWRRVAEATGDRGEVERIGTSARGEPLWAVTVAPAGSPSATAQTVFVVAGIHAMEHVGVATAVALLERACSSTSPWRTRRLVCVPMANPDGFMAVESALARGARRFVRKNARGVDLNRNFAVSWDDDYWLNRWLRSLFSPGDAPLSEPESRALDALVGRMQPTYAVSLHAFGEWIYLPFAGSREAPPDLPRLLAIARGMIASQPHRPYRTVQLGARSRLFRACGAEIDHFYARHGVMSFLIEIGAGPRLSEPSTWLHPYGWFTPPAPLLERDVANVLPAIEYLDRAESGDVSSDR